MSKLAIILTHPIQYFAPMFRVWAKEIDLIVLYCHQPSEDEVGNSGFGKSFQWDIDLMSGYESVFLQNKSKQPNLQTYNGVQVPDIGQAIKESAATHVLIMGWHCKAYRQALKFCNKNHIPVASRGDSILNPDLPLWKKIAKKIYYPFFLNKYDKHFYVGKRNKEYLKFYGVKEDKLLYSPHAVDQEFWRIERKNIENKFIFLWVAKFIEKKKPLDIIKAFQQLEINKEAELWMVGSGNLLTACKEKAQNDHNIKFLGFKNQKELKEIYAQSNCLVLSSNYEETWGLVVNEAFAAGLPAIVSKDCGCSDDMIIEGETGYTYETGNIEDLKDKMKLVIKDIRSSENIEGIENAIEGKNKTHHFENSLPAVNKFLSIN